MDGIFTIWAHLWSKVDKMNPTNEYIFFLTLSIFNLK